MTTAEIDRLAETYLRAEAELCEALSRQPRAGKPCDCSPSVKEDSLNIIWYSDGFTSEIVRKTCLHCGGDLETEAGK